MTSVTPDRSETYPSAVVAWYGLVLLLLCYFMYFVDRNILSLLVGPVRHDLNINNSQMGLLQGYTVSVFNGLMAVPFGWWADRRSRRNTLVFGVTLWASSTVASGFTTTFDQLLLTRMGLGIGEAALSPAAFSLISDYFPKSKRGVAVGVYGVGGFAGIGLSYIIGGAVLAAFKGMDHVTLPIVGDTSLWHAAFIVVGAITLVLAATIAATMTEPPRLGTRELAAQVQEPFLGHLRQHLKAFWLVIGGYICLGTVAIGWFAWLPTYFIREFKLPAATAGLQVGWVTTIGGVLGAVAGGYIADWLMRRNARGGKLPTLFMMFIVWIPCAIGLLLSESVTLSLAIAFVFTFADGIGFMQYANVMQEMFPSTMRARSIAAWNVCNSAISYGLGPLLMGGAMDYLFTGDSGARLTLSLVSLPIILIGAACAWFGRRPYDRARLAADPTSNVDLDWVKPKPVKRALAAA
jgi:MFS family permease